MEPLIKENIASLTTRKRMFRGKAAARRRCFFFPPSRALLRNVRLGLKTYGTAADFPI